MEIHLKNVGIVRDSTIKLDGLTIVAGKNNSGKTTVGKALYSLIDAVDNINMRATTDKQYYLARCIDDVWGILRRFFQLPYQYSKSISHALENFPAIRSLLSRMNPRGGRYHKDIINLFYDLLDELGRLDVSTFHLESMDKELLHYLGVKEETADINVFFNERISKAIEELQKCLSTINSDDSLNNYATASLNRTLRTEFSKQIQPVRGCEEASLIELVEDQVFSFRLCIEGDRIKADDAPISFGSQFKRAFFVDDPFVLDGSIYTARPRYNMAELENESLYGSWLNVDRIVPHAQKLNTILHAHVAQTVFEEALAEESYMRIKKMMDEILPGTFQFSDDGDSYVKEGKKLSVANLATGSKMFAIIKLLLEKGLLDNETILILDEPEAHLHPQWQNSFAEIIVMLVKELGVNVLLTTHSSNFLLALDAYMRKYKIQDKTNFYQTKTLDDATVDYECVNDDISSIYADFLDFLSEVKVLRDIYLMNDEDEE